jgi:hypothetical protein
MGGHCGSFNTCATAFFCCSAADAFAAKATLLLLVEFAEEDRPTPNNPSIFRLSMSLLIFLVLLLLLLLLLLLEVEAAALTSLPLFNAVFITIISLFYDCVRIVTSSTRESLRKRGKKTKKKGLVFTFFLLPKSFDSGTRRAHAR